MVKPRPTLTRLTSATLYTRIFPCPIGLGSPLVQNANRRRFGQFLTKDAALATLVVDSVVVDVLAGRPLDQLSVS